MSENIIDSKNFDVTDEWQKVEFIFTQQSTQNFNGLMLTIGQAGSTKNIIVDTVSMVKID